MRRYKRLAGILIVSLLIILVFSLSANPGLNNVYTKVRAADHLSEQNETVKDTVVMFIGGPNAIIRGKKVQIDKQHPEVVPMVYNDDILIPLRSTAEGLGAKVEWDGKTASITVVFDKKEIKLKQGSDIITTNGVQTKISTPIAEVKGRTFVPLGQFAEALGVNYIKIQDLIIIGSEEDVKHLTDQENKDVIQSLIEQIGVLPVVGSFDKLVELLQPSNGSNLSYYRGGPQISVEIDMNMAGNNDVAMQDNSSASHDDAAVSGKTKASSSSASVSQAPQAVQEMVSVETSPDHSTTNVQVEGVDEGDIIKTDGKYIYQVNRERVVIARAYPAKDMNIESIINFGENDFYPLEMYLEDNKLIVIGNSYMTYGPSIRYDSGGITPDDGMAESMPEKKVIIDPKIARPVFLSETVKVYVFDISNKSKVKEIRNFEIEGNYVSSRKIGNYLYLIANKYADYYRIINDKETKPAPSYKDSAVGEEIIDIDLKHVHYFPGHIQPNYMIVAGINVAENDEKAQISTFLGSGQNVYASLQNLYIAVTDYQPVKKINTPTNETNTESKERVEPDTVTVEPGVVNNVTVTVRPGKAIAVEPIMMQENTLVYKFNLNNGMASYISRGRVLGRILNQFSMDEHEGYFRIATTTGDIWRDDEFTSKNNVYVLDNLMNTIGSVLDIAPGEQIYSVRFMGERAYMVTFKLTDPLFVIDLKNPQEPKILGALKIPGYSDYLHPYDENHIIGFGKDSVEVKGQAFYTGMKIAMFDVSDVSNPILKFSEIIGDRGTESELLRNHRALLFSKEKGIMAFPVTVMEVKSGNKFSRDGFPNYGEFTFQGAYVYSIDPTDGFVLKGRITHLSREDMLKSGWDWYNSNKNISRIIYIDDTLYTISNKILKANKMDDMKEINWIEIP